MIPFLPYVVPVLTFVLGAALTLALKSQEKRATTIAMYILEVSDAANEWYNQIHELLSSSEDDLSKKSAAYLTNRLVLPRFLRSIEALRNYAEATPVVNEAEALLGLLTESASGKFRCLDVTSKANDTDPPLLYDKNFLLDPAAGDGTVTEDFLYILDRHIQTISILSGKTVSLGVLGRVALATLCPIDTVSPEVRGRPSIAGYWVEAMRLAPSWSAKHASTKHASSTGSAVGQHGQWPEWGKGR